jgi:hypothetical protein
MPDLPVEEENIDVLQNIEMTIHYLRLGAAGLTDYEVDRALEALVKNYQGEAIGKEPVLPHNPNALIVYTAVHAICDLRLGRNDAFPDGFEKSSEGEFVPISVDTLIKALKRLRKSVALWNKQGGTQGYLNYISKFVK